MWTILFEILFFIARDKDDLEAYYVAAILGGICMAILDCVFVYHTIYILRH